MAASVTRTLLCTQSFETLRQKRTKVLAEQEQAFQFPVTLVAGAWTMRQRGRAYDAFRACAKGKEAAAFCTHWQLQQSARCDITLYGEAGASLMAHAWAMKMTQLFTATRAGCTAAAVLQSTETCLCSEEVEAWAGTMQGRAAERIRQVRGFVPRGGPPRPTGWKHCGSTG